MSLELVQGYQYQAYSFGQENADHPFYHRIFVPSYFLDFSANGGILGGRNTPCMTVAQWQEKQKLSRAKETATKIRPVRIYNDMPPPTDLKIVQISKIKLDRIQQLYSEYIYSRDYEAKKREAGSLVQSLFQ